MSAPREVPRDPARLSIPTTNATGEKDVTGTSYDSDVLDMPPDDDVEISDESDSDSESDFESMYGLV